MELAGRVALVTGAASGLGAATAQRLVAGGMHVLLADRAEDEGRAVAAALGRDAVFHRVDVSSDPDVRAAVAHAVERFGGLHVAVSCAGVSAAVRTTGRDGPMPLELFVSMLRVNLVGTFNVARLAADAMRANTPTPDGERGVLVHTASVAAFDGQVGQVAYAASKAGVVGMTLPLARDLAPFGIRVVTVAPGTFDTPLLAMLPDLQRRALAARSPFPSRLGRPAEFAMLIAHAVENPMLNGETIRLDGALRLPPH